MSVLEELPLASDRSLGQWVEAAARRWAWLAPGVVAGLCVYATYLLTHDYPSFGAGLFLAMSERVLQTFPLLPETMPHYTEQGVPFAYPPLQFYVTGTVLAATGLDGVALAKHLPHVVSIVALVPAYLFAEELLTSRRAAGVATLLVATAPPVLQWQISAGGIVRAPAYLLTVVGLYTGLRLFRDGGRRWLVASLVAFTLTVLSHPTYTVFFVVSYVTMFAVYRPTVEGFLRGAVVGCGGAVLSSVWWGQVLANHGVETLTGAAGTHGGIGQQLPTLVSVFTASDPSNTRGVLFVVSPGLFDFSTPGMGILTVWSLAVVAAWLVLLSRRPRWQFLPVWALTSVLMVSKPRFSFFIGSLMLGQVIDLGLGAGLERPGGHYRSLRSRLRFDHRPELATVAVLVAVFLAVTTVGSLYAGSQLDTHAGSTSQPTFIGEEDANAMEWVAAETSPDATFVVVGDAAEWFPYLTDRTMLVGPWGIEWRGPSQYQRQLTAFNQLSTCDSSHCLTVQLDRRNVAPDYVYVPKGEYTVRGMQVDKGTELARSLDVSGRYHLVYQNSGVEVYEYEPGSGPSIQEQRLPREPLAPAERDPAGGSGVVNQ
jgi:hypothetical protein